MRKNGQSKEIKSEISEGNNLNVHFANLQEKDSLCSIQLPSYFPSEEISLFVCFFKFILFIYLFIFIILFYYFVVYLKLIII